MTQPSVKFICSENARNNGLYNVGPSVMREEYQLLPRATPSSLQIVFPLSIRRRDTSPYMMRCLRALVLAGGGDIYSSIACPPCLATYAGDPIKKVH